MSRPVGSEKSAKLGDVNSNRQTPVTVSGASISEGRSEADGILGASGELGPSASLGVDDVLSEDEAVLARVGLRRVGLHIEAAGQALVSDPGDGNTAGSDCGGEGRSAISRLGSISTEPTRLEVSEGLANKVDDATLLELLHVGVVSRREEESIEHGRAATLEGEVGPLDARSLGVSDLDSHRAVGEGQRCHCSYEMDFLTY